MCNHLAPEHLEVMVNDPDAIIEDLYSQHIEAFSPEIWHTAESSYVEEFEDSWTAADDEENNPRRGQTDIASNARQQSTPKIDKRTEGQEQCPPSLPTRDTSTGPHHHDARSQRVPGLPPGTKGTSHRWSTV